MAYVMKISIGICMHIGAKFTVNKLYSCSSGSSSSDLLVLPNFSSTIFALAVLLQLGKIEWFNAKYFGYVPLHLRTLCNIGMTLLVAAYTPNTIWIAVISCVKFASVTLATMVDNVDGGTYNMHLRSIKRWMHSDEMVRCLSLSVASVFFIRTLHSMRTMFQRSMSDGTAILNSKKPNASREMRKRRL